MTPMDEFVAAGMATGRGPLSAAEVAEAMKSERVTINRVPFGTAEVAAAIAAWDLTDAAAQQLSLELAKNVDSKLEALIKDRLGVDDLDPQALAGRCQRVSARGSGSEVYLLDGRPLARVYPARSSIDGTVITYTQVIEGLEG